MNQNQILLAFNPGVIYAAENSWNQLFKIGFSKGSAVKRVHQLNAAGTLGQWILYRSIPVLNVAKSEKILHEKARPFRVQGEIFCLTTDWIDYTFELFQEQQRKEFQCFIDMDLFIKKGNLVITDMDSACNYLMATEVLSW